jgi:hypothetical protein
MRLALSRANTPARAGGSSLLRRLATVLLSGSAVALGSVVTVAAPVSAAAGGSVLSAGQQLQAGQELVSVGGQYTLIMQDDGNLVVYGNGCVIWASNTSNVSGEGANDLSMQTDGNLVIYTGTGVALWSSRTAGTGSGNSLNMQVDGNLVVYNSAAQPLWASGAGNADQLCSPHTMGLDWYIHSPDSQYKLLMQDDGNLVIYGPNGATWATGTVGSSAVSLNMQSDGNLVLYTSAAKPVWASNTAGAGPGYNLVMQDSGILVIRNSAGTQIWSGSNPPKAGAGTAFCNPYWGTSTSGASLDNVYPCGNPNIQDAFGYQCVEYSLRFESVAYGLGGVSGASGATVVQQLQSKDGVPVASPGRGVLPVAGDVVSMWGAGQDSLGHTGVISAVSVNSSGNGTITFLDENGSIASNGHSIGRETIYVNGWVWSLHWAAPYAYNQFDFTKQGI